MQKKENKNIIVGLDLSLVATGFVVLHGEEIFDSGVIKSSPNGSLPIDEAKRLSKISKDVLAVVPEGTELVAIEGIAFMIAKTTSLVQLAAINYLVRIGLMERNIPFVIVSPPALKKFVTGKGVAQKDMMMLATFQRWGVALTENNICDAYGLSRTALAILGRDDKLIKEQEEVVSKLKLQTPWIKNI